MPMRFVSATILGISAVSHNVAARRLEHCCSSGDQIG